MLKQLSILLGLMLCASPALYAQKIKQAHGRYGENGEFCWRYYVDKQKNRVRHGSCYVVDNGFVSEGEFVDGKKNGVWKYYEVESNPNRTSSAESPLLEAEYQHGVLHGILRTKRSTIKLSNGRMVGSCTVEGWRGICDSMGRLEGLWAKKHLDEEGQSFEEKRFYESGILVNTYFYDLSSGVDIIREKHDYIMAEDVTYNADSKQFLINGTTYTLTKHEGFPEMFPELGVLKLGKGGGCADFNTDYYFTEGEQLFEGVTYYTFEPSTSNHAAAIDPVAEGINLDFTDCAKQPDIMPSFDGNLGEWLAEHITYPENARLRVVEGRVVVSFMVAKNGEIIHPTIVDSVNPELDQEALRVVRDMPRWKPGYRDGQPVTVLYRVPINFRLQ